MPLHNFHFHDPRELCAEDLRKLLPAGPLRSLYFGSEFCEDLLPEREETERYCDLAQQAGLQAVLLTPLVRPRGLARLEKLLAAVAGGNRSLAVVFNDWGVFRLLCSAYPELECRAGRLINRALRDPRLAEEELQPQAQPAARGEKIRALLRHYGVAAVETDPDLEGSYLGERESGLQRVLHLPFAFVASGRNCLFKAEVQKTGNNYASWLGSGCPAPCRDRWHPVTRADLRENLWRAGNTLFYEVPHARIIQHLERVDRIVVHERPVP